MSEGAAAAKEMARWKQHVCRGNSHFEAGRLGPAETCYQAALAEAECCLARGAAPERAIPALVVSHHNLADLYACQARHEDAMRHLLTPHERLLAILATTPGNSPVHAAALIHCTRTRAELLRFGHTTPTPAFH